ncbi:MAG: hypothetical protein RSF67_07040 [Clostridia bacterium]
MVEGLIDKKILDHIFKEYNIDCSTLISYGNQADSHFEAIKENFGENFFRKNLFILVDSDDSGKKAKQNYITKNNFDKNNIMELSELLNVEDGLSIEIEFLYNDEGYKEYQELIEKEKNNSHQIKKIKTDLFSKNFGNMNKKKIEVFVTNIKQRLGANNV